MSLRNTIFHPIHSRIPMLAHANLGSSITIGISAAGRSHSGAKPQPMSSICAYLLDPPPLLLKLLIVKPPRNVFPMYLLDAPIGHIAVKSNERLFVMFKTKRPPRENELGPGDLADEYNL